MADSAQSSARQRRRRRLVENADYISNLPDALLCHILSYLRTKDAIRTSILSSRWRMVWTLVPVLDFDDDDEEALNENFLQCVNSTLILRDGQPIQKLSLKGEYEDYGLLEACTNTALNCKVEHLELRDDGFFQRLLPPSVLTCRTIRVLKLTGLVISLLEIPSLVHLPMLKILHLKHVRVIASNDIVKLLCGCPVLEQLKLSSLMFSLFEIPSLVHFSMLKILHLKHVRVVASNDIVKLLCGCPVLEQLKLTDSTISASGITSPVHLPMLKTLYLKNVLFDASDDVVKFFCGCPVLEQLTMEHTRTDVPILPTYYPERKINLPNLVEAEMLIDLCGGNHNLFKALYNVQHLSLLIAGEMLPLSNYFPTFHNLVNLNLTFDNYRWDMLAMMLHSSPKLESLIIDKFICYHYSLAYGYPSLEPPQHVPECVSVHLKEVCFIQYEGIQSELEIARYILENASVLENMTIYWDIDLDAEERLNVTAKFSTFQRSVCQSRKLLGFHSKHINYD